MPNPHLKLQPNYIYHIYNRGINSCNIFANEGNYSHFLKLYAKYITPIANTFAWVLMPNHFHFLVRVKEDNEILTLYQLHHSQGQRPSTGCRQTSTVVNNPVDGEADGETEEKSNYKTRKPIPSNQFSHLFNAYAQHFNKQQNRHGALFERPFKRLEINSDEYLKQLVLYIHCNPVHHGFCEHPFEYSWSSYHTIISTGKTSVLRNQVLEWFYNKENFIAVHNNLSQQKLAMQLADKLD